MKSEFLFYSYFFITFSFYIINLTFYLKKILFEFLFKYIYFSIISYVGSSVCMFFIKVNTFFSLFDVFFDLYQHKWNSVSRA